MQKDFSGLAKLKSGLNSLVKQKIEYGFFPESVYPDGDQVAEIAYINEYGSGENPIRPFFETSIKVIEDRPTNPVNLTIKQAFSDAVKGLQFTKADEIGELLVEGVSTQITIWDSPPNSDETVERKGKNDPLVDSGLMRDSVKYKVNK